jgi:ribosome biogenesis protein BMS1
LSEKKKLLIHAPMSDVGGVVYDKDAVWVNVPGSFTRGNGDGKRLFIWIYIRVIHKSCAVPQGEGEQMVMDLQDVGATLEDSVAQSHIRLFGSSSNHLTIDPSRDDILDEDEDLHDDDDDEERSDEESDPDEDDDDDDDEHERQFGGTTNK